MMTIKNYRTSFFNKTELQEILGMTFPTVSV